MVYRTHCSIYRTVFILYGYPDEMFHISEVGPPLAVLSYYKVSVCKIIPEYDRSGWTGAMLPNVTFYALSDTGGRSLQDNQLAQIPSPDH